MIYQKQLYLHEPDKMQFGDCHRTSLACLLNIPVEDSPHFIGEYERRKALRLHTHAERVAARVADQRIPPRRGVVR